MTSERIKHTYHGRSVDQYVIASDKQRPITVRIGLHGVYACLTCIKTDCEHCVKVEAWVAANEPQAASEAA